MEKYDPPSMNRHSIRLRIDVKPENAFIGECVYCGSKENLTDEHTIPKGLWGKHFLIDGSCKTCANATTKFELRVLRSMEVFREFFGGPTRHSRKRGRWTRRRLVTNQTGHALDVPIGATAQAIFIPVFDYIPRKLFGDVKGRKHRLHDVKTCLFTKKIDPALSGYGLPPVGIVSDDWAKFYLKVAYTEYIRTFDPSFRSKAISDIIIHWRGDQSNYLGGRNSAPAINHVYILSYAALARSDGGYALVGYLRLFPFMNTPSHLVYLGDVPAGEKLPPNLPVRATWTRKNLWPNYVTSGPPIVL